jgi:hypothetical protein
MRTRFAGVHKSAQPYPPLRATKGNQHAGRRRRSPAIQSGSPFHGRAGAKGLRRLHRGRPVRPAGRDGTGVLRRGIRVPIPHRRLPLGPRLRTVPQGGAVKLRGDQVAGERAEPVFRAQFLYRRSVPLGPGDLAEEGGVSEEDHGCSSERMAEAASLPRRQRFPRRSSAFTRPCPSRAVPGRSPLEVATGTRWAQTSPR